MAESDKGTASTKAKEKKAVLDDDIWSTNFGAESDDSSMDFKFEPVTKGKKKEFKFDQLDMDFPLDGDFGKIKPFKIDMGDLDFSSPPNTSKKSKEIDLDFSSPPKEGIKIKERLEGESAKSGKGKQDCFATFSFDFNDLDKFDLDDVLPKRTKELNKDDGNKGIQINSIDKTKDYSLDKFDLDDVLLKRTEELNKDDGNKGIQINSIDKTKDYSSEVQLADTDARDADVLKEKSAMMKTSNSKEDQMESEHIETSSERENTDKENQVEKKTCQETQQASYREPQLPTQSAVVAKSCQLSHENPEAKDQSSWSSMNKMGAPDASEPMLTISTDSKSGDADSNMQSLIAIVGPPLVLENENFQLKKMIPQHGDDIHLKNLPEAESESTVEGKTFPKGNVLQGDMDRATVSENVLHAEESPVVDISKLGAHAAECTSGRQKTPMEIAPSHVSRLNLTRTTEDKTMEDKTTATQVLPTRPSLVSLRKDSLTSLHSSPGARNSAHSARSRSNFDNKTGLVTQEATGGCLVSESKTKLVTDQSAREHFNVMAAQMKNNLGVISVPNDGKAADRGTTFLGNEKKKEDIKMSSFHVQSKTLLADFSSKSNYQASEKLKPKTPTFQSVRKLKMDTVVGKLSALNVSKKMPNLSALKISSAPALKDKTVAAKKFDTGGMNVMTKTFPLVGIDKTHSLASSMKRKLVEASDAVSAMSHPSKRLTPSQIRNPIEDSQRLAQEEVTRQTSLKVGIHNNIQDCHLKNDTDKQPEFTFKLPREMNFADVGVNPVIEVDETIKKAEACGKGLDEVSIILRKKLEEAKELLVRVLVNNNKLLLLRDPTQAQKLGEAQNFACRLLARELPSRRVDPSLT